MKKIVIPLIILLTSVAIAALLILNKEKPDKKQEEETPFLVETMAYTFENLEFLVYAQGTVQPKNRTVLSAQVSGKVVSLSESFIEGGFFNEGDVLVELESDDYQTDLLLAEAELARAQAALDEEVARGRVAEKEWRSVNTTVPPELGLRKPQLAREKANLQAAEAQLLRAKRNLERTKIRAPYDGLVKSRNVDLGQVITVAGQLGEIYSTDVAEVRLPLTDNDIAFIGDMTSRQPLVSLRAQVAGETRFWQGKMVRNEAVLDESRRVIFGVVQIQDPYNRKRPTHQQALRFGRFVKAEIAGIEVENVVKLPREVGRLDGTVLTVDTANTLHINEIGVVRSDESFLYIVNGLTPNHQVVLSAVPNPYEGMQVRVVDSEDIVEPSETVKTGNAVQAGANL
ncbi:MAG: efflux RND transporter periplasmic adaptor subunit [Pseudomonadota bacterium]